MNLSLADTTVLLTGPTSGLGLAIVRLCLANKLPLRLIGRRLERLPAAFHADAYNVKLLEQDLATVSEAGQLHIFANRLDKLLKSVSTSSLVVIDNAALIGPIGPTVQVQPADYLRCIAVNQLAPFMLLQAALRWQTSGRHLGFLHVSSGAAQRPVAGWAAYCASKAAATQTCSVAAAELENTLNSWIECIDPGMMDTGMQQTIRQTPDTEQASFMDFRRLHAAQALRSTDKVAGDLLARIAANKP